jgi:hypothetical protein
VVDPSAFAPFNFADSYAKGLQIRQAREQQQNQTRLGDLLPQAVNGDTSAMEQIAHIDPRMFMQLNQQQREKAQAEIADLTGAVRWAIQDPAQQAQRWNQVVDFYSSHIPDVAQYRDHPEMAETALMKLGQMGAYLKSAPQAEYKTLEPGGSLIDVSGGQPRVVIAPNDGSYQTGAPVQSGGGIPRVSDQQSYDAVPPGAQYMTPDGHVRVKGGQSGGGSTGGFPY